MIRDPINELLSRELEKGKFPSCSYLVAESGRVRFSGAIGNAVEFPETVPAGTETIYDLASLTKPLITGLLAAILLQDSRIGLQHKISRYLGGFSDNDKSGITIRDLLTHVSGFEAWCPFYLQSQEDVPPLEIVLGQIVDSALEYETGTRVVYSDFNFLILQAVIEKICGASLDEIANRKIFQPLGLEKTHFNPPFEIKLQIAASEIGNFYEKRMCLDRFPAAVVERYRFRNQLIWGEVHDGNCYFMGGVAGHAGLFSDAEDTLRMATQFIPGTSDLLENETCDLFYRNFTKGLNQSRSIGFQLAETEGCSAGSAISPSSFGHLGFTGTSLWLDPTKERIYILLTNRTHTKNEEFPDLFETRMVFHNTAHELLEKSGA